MFSPYGGLIIAAQRYPTAGRTYRYQEEPANENNHDTLSDPAFFRFIDDLPSSFLKSAASVTILSVQAAVVGWTQPENNAHFMKHAAWMLFGALPLFMHHLFIAIFVGIQKKCKDPAFCAPFFICTTVAIVISVILNMICLLYYPSLQTATCFIGGCLALPIFFLCISQDGEMHKVIFTIFHCAPLLFAIFVEELAIEYRSALLLSPLVCLSYEVAELPCRTSSKWTDNRALVKTLLRSSGAATLIGVSISATALALDLHLSAISVTALILAIVGALAFNACLVIHRWKIPLKTVDENVRTRRDCAIYVILFIMLVALFAVYQTLVHHRITVIIPIISLVCLYFIFVYVDDSIKAASIDCGPLLPIFGYFGALALCIVLAVPVTPFYLRSGSTVTIPTSKSEHAKEWKLLRETMWIAALQFALLFIYSMMTALVRTEATKQALQREANAEEERQRLRPVPIQNAEVATRAFVKSTHTPDARIAPLSSFDDEMLSDTGSESIMRNATLHMPD